MGRRLNKLIEIEHNLLANKLIEKEHNLLGAFLFSVLVFWSSGEYFGALVFIFSALSFQRSDPDPFGIASRNHCALSSCTYRFGCI